MKLWNAGTCETRRVLKGHDNPITAVDFSSDGERIVSGAEDGSIRLWETKSGKCIDVSKARGSVNGVAFTPDGTRIVIGSRDRMVSIWNLSDREESTSLCEHPNALNGIAISQSGSHLATITDAAILRVWNLETGTEEVTLEGDRFNVTCAAFNADGTRIAAGRYRHNGQSLTDRLRSPNGGVHLWEVNSGKAVFTPIAHDTDITCIAFSREGDRIVSGSKEGFITFWHSVIGKETFSIPAHSRTVADVAFSEDGSRIVSGSTDGTIRVWHASSIAK